MKVVEENTIIPFRVVLALVFVGVPGSDPIDCEAFRLIRKRFLVRPLSRKLLGLVTSGDSVFIAQKVRNKIGIVKYDVD